MLPSLKETYCLEKRNHTWGYNLYCKVCGAYSPNIEEDKYRIKKILNIVKRKAKKK